DRGLSVLERIPRHTDTGSKRMVIARRKPFWHPLVSGYYQPQREHGRVTRVLEHRVGLPRPEGLIAQPRVIDGLVVLPAQAIVQGKVRFDLPTVLRKQVDRVTTNVLSLCRSLQIGVGKTQQ